MTLQATPSSTRALWDGFLLAKITVKLDLIIKMHAGKDLFGSAIASLAQGKASLGSRPKEA